MRASQFFLATLKEAPQEAELPSHKLMLRGGLIRKLGSGLYSWLPMGMRVLHKVERIVREEMDRAGALEIIMPPVQPAELWQETGRWDLYGPMMLRIKDRAEREFCYAPTAEEVVTDIARQGAAQLPPAAGELLPDPDQVPRRDPAALRRAARARVLHEGRLLVRRGRGRDARVLPEDVRRVRAHLHAPGPHVPPRRGRLRRDRRQRLARVPGARRFRRGPDRLLRRVRLRGQHREGRGAGARRSPRAAPGRADAQGPDARHLHLRRRGEALERAARAHREGDPALRQPPRAHGAHPRRPHAERDQGRQAARPEGLALGERRGDPRRRPTAPRATSARSGSTARRSRSSPTARSRRCRTSSAARTRRTSTSAA